jgi:hypothetical protein
LLGGETGACHLIAALSTSARASWRRSSRVRPPIISSTGPVATTASGPDRSARPPSPSSRRVRTPVAVRDLLERAARAEGDRGYDPATVRAGVRRHQGSKPAVYLLLERGGDGSFRAVTDIPEPEGFGRADLAGDLVLPAATIPGSRVLRHSGWW